MKGTLAEFYQQHATSLAALRPPPNEHGGFNIYRRSDFTCKNSMATHRRDFYKISLIRGQGQLHYAPRSITVDADALLFSNPLVPYAWEATSTPQTGYFCVFREDFVLPDRRSRGLAGSPLFQAGADPVFFLTPAQRDYLSQIFEQMLQDIQSDYTYKYELLRSQVHVVIHEAMKMQPAHRYFEHPNAPARMTHLFVELLERQFPIDSTDHRLSFKTPADFADQLSVHVNHLNRAVKQVTGCTTGQLISRRVVREAEALLTYTRWNVAEIAYCLGFNEPAYFSHFFKKHTGQAPGQFRRPLV